MASRPASKQNSSGAWLRCLKATDIGGIEGARDRELEWERKNDQAGEGLLE